MKKEYGVYKFVEKKSGRIIYIGKSNVSLDNRIFAHLAGKGIDEKFKKYKNKCEIYTAILPNSVEADIVEKCLINKYKPELNVVDKQEGLSEYIKIKELKWEAWDIKKKKEQRKKSRDPFINMIQALSADDIANMLFAIQCEEIVNNELKVLREKPIIEKKKSGSIQITEYGKRYIELLSKSKLCNLYKYLKISGIPEEDINAYNYAQLIQYLLNLELKVTESGEKERIIKIEHRRPIPKEGEIWIFECQNIFGYSGDVYISKDFQDCLWQGGRKVKTVLFWNRDEVIKFILDLNELCRKYATKQKEYFVIDADYIYNSKSRVTKRLAQKDHLAQICIFAPGMSSCLIPKIYGHKEKMTEIFVDRYTLDFLYLGIQSQLQKEEAEEAFAESFY